MLPEVTETSLSLSFDEQVLGEHSEQGYTSQQILPHPKQHAQQTKPQNQPKKQQQQDQENDHRKFQKERSAGFAKGKEWLKQDRNGRALPNSPSREPLKQILPPNQTSTRVKSQTQTHLPQSSHKEQRTAVEVPNRKRNSPGRTVQGRAQATVSGRSTAHSVKGPNAFHRSDSQNDEPKQKTPNPTARPSPQGSEDVDSRALQNLPRKQMISSNPLGVENRGRQVGQQQLVRQTDDNSFPPQGNQVEKPFLEKPFLETVLEEDSVDGTLNKTMDETELELQIIATSSVTSISKTDCESRGSTAGLITDQNGLLQHGYVQTQRRTEIRDELSSCPIDSEHCGKKEVLDNTEGVISHSSAQQQGNENERRKRNREANNVLVYQEGTFQGNKQVGDGVTAKPMSAEGLTLPDPYQLLIRQEAQLRELQEQVLTGIIDAKCCLTNVMPCMRNILM